MYHVVARGNERGAIFRDAADRARFLEILEGASRRYQWHVLAFSLLTTHYHLLVQTPKANLSSGMRQLNGVYAQSFNRRHGRDGHLFQGRYGARLVQRDEHLLAALRYVVRNPLEAGLCKRLEDWQWSSHLQTIGVRPPGFLAVDRMLAYLGQTRTAARRCYLELVEQRTDPAPTSHPLIAGDEAFAREHIALVAPSADYPRAYLRTPRPALADIVRKTADEAGIAVAYLDHGYSMREIATHLGCSVPTIHRRVRAFERREPAGARKAET